jgi:hypothetical protein
LVSFFFFSISKRLSSNNLSDFLVDTWITSLHVAIWLSFFAAGKRQSWTRSAFCNGMDSIKEFYLLSFTIALANLLLNHIVLGWIFFFGLWDSVFGIRRGIWGILGQDLGYLSTQVGIWQPVMRNREGDGRIRTVGNTKFLANMYPIFACVS